MDLNREVLLFDKIKKTNVRSNSFAVKESPVVLFSVGLDSDAVVEVLIPDTGVWTPVVKNGTATVLSSKNTRYVIAVPGTYRVTTSATSGAVVFYEFEPVSNLQGGKRIRQGILTAPGSTFNQRFEVIESPVVVTAKAIAEKIPLEMRIRALDAWGPIVGNNKPVEVSADNTHFVITTPGDYRIVAPSNSQSYVYYRESEIDGEYSTPSLDALLNGSSSSDVPVVTADFVGTGLCGESLFKAYNP